LAFFLPKNRRKCSSFEPPECRVEFFVPEPDSDPPPLSPNLVFQHRETGAARCGPRFFLFQSEVKGPARLLNLLSGFSLLYAREIGPPLFTHPNLGELHLIRVACRFSLCSVCPDPIEGEITPVNQFSFSSVLFGYSSLSPEPSTRVRPHFA